MSRRRTTYIDLTTVEGRHKFYKTKEWGALRSFYLSTNPYCKECEKYGLFVLVDDVHHIIDIAGNIRGALDIHNLEGLCNSCHAQKTFAKNAENDRNPEAVNLKWRF
jgi:5-methylcytosine-specific restriction endonuclease McrA